MQRHGERREVGQRWLGNGGWSHRALASEVREAGGRGSMGLAAALRSWVSGPWALCSPGTWLHLHLRNVSFGYINWARNKLRRELYFR